MAKADHSTYHLSFLSRATFNFNRKWALSSFTQEQKGINVLKFQVKVAKEKEEKGWKEERTGNIRKILTLIMHRAGAQFLSLLTAV